MPKSLSATLAILCASLVIFFASGLATHAATLSGVSLVTDGQCGLNGSSDTFSLNMNASASEFPSVDETITFPDSSTQDQDVDIFYVTDAANVVIGRYAQGFVTSQAVVGGAFFSVNQRPTVSGNFTVRLVDELDRTPDLALGATFSTSNTILGSTSFDAAALDPDCVPVPTDTTAPQASSVTIQSNNTTTSMAKVGDTVTLQMTFSESLGTAPSVTLIGQTASVAGSGTSWSASVTVTSSSPQGAATFSISGYKDDAGNTGTTVTSTTNGSSVTVDRTSPSTSLASSVSGPTNTSPIPVTVSFTEAVSGFTAADLTVSGATVSNFAGSGSSYSFDLTPSGDGTVTVDIAGGVAQDAAGNGNTAATQFSIVYDQSGPSTSLASSVSGPTNTSPIPVTVSFTEAVS
ncbi:Ig-like domain-containing protein, partial [Celeribacter neptunius]